MIRELLCHHPLPTIGTYQAAGVISHDLEKYFIGRIGLFKNQPGDQILDLADVIITIGYNPVEYDPEIWNSYQTKKIIHINYMPANIRNTYAPTLEVIGNIALNIEKIILQLNPSSAFTLPEAIQKIQRINLEKIQAGKNHAGPRIHPLRFINDLRTLLSDEDTVISDI